MGDEDLVTNGQCDSRINKVYEKLDNVTGAVNRILGGIAVATIALTLCVGGVFVYWNYRFTVVDSHIQETATDIKNIEKMILF